MLLSAALGLAGGALAARLAGLRIYLVPLSAGFLGVGYYLAYWRGFGSRRQRVILWIATVVAVFFWVIPHIFTTLIG